MENFLENESVKKVNNFIKQFDSSLEITFLDKTARTAKDAATALNCEVGAIVKSLVLRADNSFLICLVAGDKRCSLNKLNPFLAACASVWIHGDSAKHFGPGLIAEDIVKAIPHTLTKLKKWKIFSKMNQ